MASRSIASLSLNFGLVAIPVRLYSATESSAAIRFKLMAQGGRRLRQQYVAEPSSDAIDAAPSLKDLNVVEAVSEQSVPAAVPKVVEFPRSRPDPAGPPEPVETVVERSDMVKGYEYQRGHFVLFTPEELKALQSESRKTIDIVSFIPDRVVDPIYYDKAYLLAPDKRGAKPYHLLLRALQDTGRCALARWAFRAKEYVVQIRAGNGGLVLQQLLYAEEVRSFSELQIESVDVGVAELDLAKRLIEQISADSYDPTEFVDEEKKRILETVERKIAGKGVRVATRATTGDGRVVDLLSALRASLQAKSGTAQTAQVSKASIGQRKAAKRASGKFETGSVSGKRRRSP